MRGSSRIGLVVAGLLLGVTFLRPLWHIGLIAPQYPEGLGMYIWSSQITGQKPQDLNSINGLNHYIGMKAIIPESIPELRFMPMVIGGLIALALMAALLRKRPLLYAWTGLFIVLALVGLADFWKWGYDYGHNLDPTAAIKVPGMAYQPPLVGTKQILNFQATAWPALGGWCAMAALALGVVLSVIEWRGRRASA